MTVIEVEKQIFIEKSKLFKINTHFTPLPYAYFDTFTSSIEQLILEIIPQNLFDQKECFSEDEIHPLFEALHSQLPIISYTPIHDSPSTFALTILCYGDYTHGIGRFIPDMISRWLIPGRQLGMSANCSAKFNFIQHPKHSYYITQHFINIADEQELKLIKKNLAHFIQEMRLNILAVYHARYTISMKKLSFEEKSALIQENISTLLDRPSIATEHNAFDQMQNFLIKLSYEKKLSEIKENISYLMYKRPKTFDRDIFDEIHNVALLFKETFTAIRDPKHVSRIIAFLYLFKKIINQKLLAFQNERHLSLKLLKTKLNTKSQTNPVIGILITLSFSQDTERFEKKHLLQALQFCLKDVRIIKDSFIIDRREDKICSYYLEIEKAHNALFTLNDIKILKRVLPTEILSRIERIINPIFMPRNEEEMLRNIIMLSKQLRYVKDIPQVIISYDKQTGLEISFTVILVRLIKKQSHPLQELFSNSETFLKFFSEEVKVVGYLKKKYPKEANIFKLSLKKSPFFRKDHSLNLQKARQAVANELVKVFGEFRDFNGGMIQKQTQSLESIKEYLHQIGKEKHDFLLENFFYGIKPGLMQSILPSSVIKHLFLQLLQVIELEQNHPQYKIQTKSYKKFYLISIGFTKHLFKEQILNAISKLQIPSFDLTYTYIEIDELLTLNIIYNCDNIEKHQRIINTIVKVFDNTKA